MQICTQAPEFIWICNCALQIQMVPCLIWFCGRKMQGFQWWCPCDVLCNSSGHGVRHLTIKPTFPLFVFFQLQCMLNPDHLFIPCFFPCIFQIFASSNQPLAYCHMQCGWVPSFVASSRCQIHRHYSVSEIDVLLSRCNYFCCLLWWSCHVDMLLTPNLRLRPKPIKCK